MLYYKLTNKPKGSGELKRDSPKTESLTEREYRMEQTSLRVLEMTEKRGAVERRRGK